MLEVIKDKNGCIESMIAYQLFDDDYNMTEDGKHIGITELFIHDRLDGVGIMKHYIRVISRLLPDTTDIFFVREFKYKGREARRYTREQLERLAGTVIKSY